MQLHLALALARRQQEPRRAMMPEWLIGPGQFQPSGKARWVDGRVRVRQTQADTTPEPPAAEGWLPFACDDEAGPVAMILATISRSGSTACPSTTGRPFSPAFCRPGSSGKVPRNGTSNLAAIPRGPSPAGGNTDIWMSRSSSSGHFARISSRVSSVTSLPDLLAKLSPDTGTCMVAMFSTTPRTGILVFLQKLSSLRTSIMATSCGVVTTTAPSSGLSTSLSRLTIVMCSSEVPGGVSMTR
mmetsp:Transcript_15674/g.44363  ORF Transcript_15674/g.44363 Transcript_15674/m.44363 type:complete len:242 (+) Transcript_15674:303-1028(+)